jgi:hypothetical protein
MKAPMDKLLDAVSWQKLPGKWPFKSDTPFATHGGFLTIGPVTLKVYQLNDGRRVIAADDLKNIFGIDE